MASLTSANLILSFTCRFILVQNLFLNDNKVIFNQGPEL